ncbi:MAG: ABC transporter permease subunit [Alphaproteobacteria bacterium]|nr:ABC transporter permease subunit [Alphaproteobacteria bacterium]
MLHDTLICFCKDFRFYFSSRLMYLLLAAYMLLLSAMCFFSPDFYAKTEADLLTFFMYQPVVLAIITPALTMRSFADEARNRTLEIILSQPISRLSVVLAKFLASWSVCIIMLASSALIWAVLAALTDLNNQMILFSYLAAVLMSASLCALSLFAAVFSYSFVASFILGVLFCAMLLNINFGFVSSLFSQDSLLAMKLARSFSFMRQYTAMVSGQISLSACLYFISLSAAFVFLTYAVLEYKRR